jgi:hypothetical protein
MYALQIAIALAVSMLIFSTLATMVVEIINKIFRVRQKGLTKMLEAFYETEVKERIQVMLVRDGAAVEDMPEFIKKVTSMTGGSHTLPTIEFIRRLAETEVGKRMAQHADNEVDDLIDDITDRYEDHGRKASQFFRRYSQLGTVIVSVLIALCLNINAVTIFRTIQNNRELTQAIAGQAEQAMAAYQLIAESKKATAPKDETGKTSADTDIEKLKGSMQEFRKAVDDAEKLGLPIGWEDDQFFNSKNIEKMGLFVWFLTTVFTGFLIGLGGPFWFDMVKRLTGVSQVTGALIRQPPPQAKTGDGTKPQKSAPTVLAEDPKTAFKLIVRAQHIIDGNGAEVGRFPGPRALRL